MVKSETHRPVNPNKKHNLRIVSPFVSSKFYLRKTCLLDKHVADTNSFTYPNRGLNVPDGSFLLFQSNITEVHFAELSLQAEPPVIVSA